jgi:hypothetical protein
VNVFADLGHGGIRDRDIDLHLARKMAIPCMNLSSAGLKSQPA